MPTRSCLCSAVLLSALVAASGCDVETSNAYYNNEPYRADSSAWGGGGYRSVPSTAQRVARHSGHIRYTAPADGTFWVGDDDGYRVLWSQNVRKGDTVFVEPEKSRVYVNTSIVSADAVNPSGNHSLFFREAWHGDHDSPAWGNHDSNNYSPGTHWSGDTHYGGIPSNAAMAAHGTGRISWRANHNGTVWIGDNNSRTTIDSRRITKNDTITVDPDKGRIFINSNPVRDARMDGRHDRGIFFSRS